MRGNTALWVWGAFTVAVVGSRLAAACNLRSSPARGAVRTRIYLPRLSRLPVFSGASLWTVASSTTLVLHLGTCAFVTAATHVLSGQPRPQDPRGIRSFPEGTGPRAPGLPSAVRCQTSHAKEQPWPPSQLPSPPWAALSFPPFSTKDLLSVTQ